MKHEFPLKDLGTERILPLSETSSSSNGGKTTGLFSLERLAKQRETLNQLLDMTAEESTEWKEIKTRWCRRCPLPIHRMEEDPTV